MSPKLVKEKAQSKKHRAALAALMQSVRAGEKAAAAIGKYGKAAIAAGVTRDQFVAALQKLWGFKSLRIGSKNYNAVKARISYYALKAGYKSPRNYGAKAPAKQVTAPRGATAAVLEFLANQFGVESDEVNAVLRAIVSEASDYVVE